MEWRDGERYKANAFCDRWRALFRDQPGGTLWRNRSSGLALPDLHGRIHCCRQHARLAIESFLDFLEKWPPLVGGVCPLHERELFEHFDQPDADGSRCERNWDSLPAEQCNYCRANAAIQFHCSP